MKQIIAVISPFDRRQEVTVYEDGNKLDMQKPTLKELIDTIFSLADQYQITHIDLVGPKQFNKGLMKQLQSAELVKYGNNMLEINLVYKR